MCVLSPNKGNTWSSTHEGRKSEKRNGRGGSKTDSSGVEEKRKMTQIVCVPRENETLCLHSLSICWDSRTQDQWSGTCPCVPCSAQLGRRLEEQWGNTDSTEERLTVLAKRCLIASRVSACFRWFSGWSRKLLHPHNPKRWTVLSAWRGCYAPGPSTSFLPISPISVQCAQHTLGRAP